MKTLLRCSKHILHFLILFPFFFILFSFSNDPTVLETLLKKLQQYQSERPHEKLYVHFDKPFYAAGENMWFKAYLVEASIHSLDSQSRVVYVDLSDKDNNIFQHRMLYVSNGITFGDFQLPDTLQEGSYLIRAYTQYMKNAGEDFFFKKEFSVLNPLKKFDEDSEENKFSPDSVDLQFFPEGGNLVACGFNRVAFKAIAPDGKFMPVQGEIIDENNAVVTTFKTQHDGMGLIRINPTAGKKYFARIKTPYPIQELYPLPQVHTKGYSMQVDQVGKNIKVIVLTNSDKPVSGSHVLNLVVQSRGKAYYAQQGTISNNAFFVNIPRSKFPEGISQITIFDADGNPVAERLIHQNHNETVLLSLKTDTSTYGKRKQVIVYMDAQYRNQLPAAGNFSISVYDDRLLKNPEKYPLSITNYLSLTSDLKGYIENPGYYFKDSLPETRKNLDLLMMVHGWRRFTWNDILENNGKPQQYQHERGIPISGRVVKAWKDKIPVGSILKVMTMTGNVAVLRPDSLGRFYTDEFLFYDSMDLVIKTENAKGRKQPYKFLLNPVSSPPESQHKMTGFAPFDASRYLKQQAEEMSIDKSSKVKVLQEVQIVSKKEIQDSRRIGSKSDVIDVRKLSDGYTNIFQMLQSRVPGLIISGNPPNMTVRMRGSTPAFLMNGMLSSQEMVSLMSPNDIEMIEIVRGSVMYGGGPAINLVLKANAWDREAIGISQASYPGFYREREFYSPRYDVPETRHQLEDKRTTLFWEPVLETDQTGKAGIAFFTADVASRYRVVVEGITADGYPGTATCIFEVK